MNHFCWLLNGKGYVIRKLSLSTLPVVQKAIYAEMMKENITRDLDAGNKEEWWEV